MLFSCIFFLGSFGVGASAVSEENLIDSNLSNWTVLHPEKCSVIPASSSLYLVRIYGVQMPPAIEEGPSPVWYLGGAFDLTDTNITVGNKYTLSFNFPDPDRYVSSSTGSNSFLGDNSGTLIVGLCSYISDDSVEAIEGCYFTIDKNNFNSVKDTDIQLSFEMPSGVVNPCICFYYMNFNGTNTVCFYLKDFKLVDESEAKEDGFINKLLNGILGLFVPSDDYFDNLTKQVQDMFSNSFGFAYDVTTFFTELMNKISDLLVANAGNQFVFTLPGQEFDLNLKDTEGASLSSHHIKLWEDITIDFSFFKTMPGLSILYNIYCVSLHMICLFLLLEYAKKTFEKVMA